MIAAVFFDLDETLFARTLSLERFVEDQLGKRYPDIFPDLEQTVGRFLELDCRGMKPKHGVYQALLAEIGRVDPDLVAELFNDYEQNAWRFASGFDGMEDALNQIRKLKSKIGIVTNGQTHIQIRSLLALNLDRMVDAYVISEAVGLRKPDPEIFHLAVAKLSVRPQDCVFVGDSPTTDIVGAKQVGMKTVWFPNGAVWPDNLSTKADAEIQSLSELQAALQRLA